MQYACSSEFDHSEDWRNVSDIERWGSLALGSVVLAYGLRHPLARAGLIAAAAPLVHRGLMGHCYVYSALGVNTAAHHADTRVALSGTRGIHVREAIRIEKPLVELYRFWREFENLPRFMTNLEEVRDLGSGRSHWVAKGPGDVKVEWDAEIVNEVENKVIGWRSLAGSDVSTAGSVTFEPVRGGEGTLITVHLQYAAPGGQAGSLLAWLMGREPSQTIREDLRRLKQILETGEIPRTSIGEQRVAAETRR